MLDMPIWSKWLLSYCQIYCLWSLTKFVQEFFNFFILIVSKYVSEFFVFYIILGSISTKLRSDRSLNFTKRAERIALSLVIECFFKYSSKEISLNNSFKMSLTVLILFSELKDIRLYNNIDQQFKKYQEL